jgi:hypothetical protein
MTEAGAVKVRNLRLEIRSCASRDRHGDVFSLDFATPHKHLVAGVTVAN